MTDTAQNWALITGASSGIGRALAAAPATRGIALIDLDRDAFHGQTLHARAFLSEDAPQDKS